MHYIQYEELCRLFIADKYKLSIEEVKSVRIPSPTHPNLVEFKNQIDLYWILEDEFQKYVNIADTKWRKESDNVQKGSAQNLQFVKNDINNANKAILITNTGFDDGAIGIADKYGMGLYIVLPDFDLAILDPDLIDRKIIQTRLQELVDNGKPIYDYKIERKALDSGSVDTAQTTVPDKTGIHSKEIKHTPENRMVETTSNRGTPPSIQKVQSGQGGSQTGRQGGPPSGRQGGPPSGRQGGPPSGRQGGPPSGRQGGPPSGRQGGSGPPKGPAKGGGGTSNRSR